MTANGTLMGERQLQRRLQRKPGSGSDREPAGGDYARDIGNACDARAVAGNQALQHRIQTRLHVSTPGDPYEREADEVAERVMRAPADAGPPRISPLAPGVQRACADCAEEEAVPVQPKRADGEQSGPSAVPHRLATATRAGQPMRRELRNFFEPRFGRDLDHIRIHTDTAARRAARRLNAKAFTTGRDIAFDHGQYRPDTSTGRHLLAHEITHVLQQDGYRRAVQRREYGPLEDSADMGKGDWTHADRLTNSEQWRSANHYNLTTGNSAAYTQIDQRRDFYLWFYHAMVNRGHDIRWPLAAYAVADGANEGANRMNENARAIAQSLPWIGSDPVSQRSDTLETLLRRGNQVIFDDVFPKLHRVYTSDTKLVGEAARQWDAQTLIEEQNLIQPMYAELSPQDLQVMSGLAKQQGLAGSSVPKALVALTSMFQDSAGSIDASGYNTGGNVPPFPSGWDITDPVNRFRYGMYLADYFSPVSGNVDKHREGSMQRALDIPVPTASTVYTNGDMLKRFDRFKGLHRLSSAMTNSDTTQDQLRAMIQKLSPDERAVLTRDPWYVATLRHQHGMSPNQAELLLRSEDLSKCGNLFQVIGRIEGVSGDIKAGDNIIVWVDDKNWTNTWHPERVVVQAVSNTAYARFAPSPFKWVWKDALQCYPPKRPEPEPVPDPEPIRHTYPVYFDTGSATLHNDSHEFSGIMVLNGVLERLAQYGDDDAIDSIELHLVGHASPVWKGAKSEMGAFGKNFALASARAEYIRHYIYSRYGEFKGAVPVVVRAPEAAPVAPLENTTPATPASTGSLGSIEGLLRTFDPDDNDQKYRRVDVNIVARPKRRGAP